MSEYKDKTITCKDCGEEFIFTARDQAFYAEKGFNNEPKRCKACRDKKKAERNEKFPNKEAEQNEKFSNDNKEEN